MFRIPLSARNAGAGAPCAVLLGACAHFQPEKVGQTEGREYTITVKNTLARERFAIGDDEKRFSVVKVGPAGTVTVQ